MIDFQDRNSLFDQSFTPRAAVSPSSGVIKQSSETVTSVNRSKISIPFERGLTFQTSFSV